MAGQYTHTHTHTKTERRKEEEERESDRSERESFNGGWIAEAANRTYLEDEGKIEREGYTLWLV